MGTPRRHPSEEGPGDAGSPQDPSKSASTPRTRLIFPRDATAEEIADIINETLREMGETRGEGEETSSSSPAGP